MSNLKAKYETNLEHFQLILYNLHVRTCIIRYNL